MGRLFETARVVMIIGEATAVMRIGAPPRLGVGIGWEGRPLSHLLIQSQPAAIA